MADDTPFFIVGSGRSGTTLLRLILAGHSRMHIPPETWFIADLVRELPLTGPLTPAETGRAIEIMTRHRRWPDMGIAAADLKAWVTALDAPKLADIINLVYHCELEIHGKPRFGDKTPAYIHIIPELSAIYPGAKFIHLIRDGRDVAISYFKVDGPRYYEQDFIWARAMHRWHHYRGSPYAAQILEVRYEDLVTDLEHTVTKICAFLGEDFEPQMLDWQPLVGKLIPERERTGGWHTTLNQPLLGDAVGVWRRELSGLECFAMESCLHDDLRRLGYPLRFAGVGWRPLLSVSSWILFAAAPLLKRGIPYLQRRNFLPETIYI